jgi:hypothetical protein
MIVSLSVVFFLYYFEYRVVGVDECVVHLYSVFSHLIYIISLQCVQVLSLSLCIFAIMLLTKQWKHYESEGWNLCWLHWKNFSWQHWIFFFRLCTLCIFAKPIMMAKTGRNVQSNWCIHNKLVTYEGIHHFYIIYRYYTLWRNQMHVVKIRKSVSIETVWCMAPELWVRIPYRSLLSDHNICPQTEYSVVVWHGVSHYTRLVLNIVQHLKQTHLWHKSIRCFRSRT